MKGKTLGRKALREIAGIATDAGLPLMAFTCWEGVVAGLICHCHGVLAAKLSHGLAVFLLASAVL